MSRDDGLFDYLLRLGDSPLILAQRLGEGVGKGPGIDEGMALTNVGLLPAAMLGLDVGAIREGAGLALAPVLSKKPASEVPAALGRRLGAAAR